MRRRVVGVAALVATGLLASGCSAWPSADDVAERFLIEYEDIAGFETSGGEFDELAASAATHMADGYCAEPAYFTALSDAPDVRDATLLTCFMYYDSEMTDGLRDQAQAVILREVTERGE